MEEDGSIVLIHVVQWGCAWLRCLLHQGGRDLPSIRGISSVMMSLGKKSDYTSCLGSREGVGVMEAWAYVPSEGRIMIRNLMFQAAFLSC